MEPFDDGEFEVEFPDRTDIIEIARHIFSLTLRTAPVGAAQMSVEQLRALIRDHFESAGCDYTDDDQLMAAAIGSLITIQMQIQYTQVGTTAAMVPASAINMIVDPFSRDETDRWRNVLQILTTGQEKKSRSGRLLRRLLHFRH